MPSKSQLSFLVIEIIALKDKHYSDKNYKNCGPSSQGTGHFLGMGSSSFVEKYLGCALVIVRFLKLEIFSQGKNSNVC